MPEPRDLIHIPGEDIIVGPKASKRKRNVRGRRGSEQSGQSSRCARAAPQRMPKPDSALETA